MAERKITPDRILVGVKTGKGLIGRIMDLDNPVSAVNFMVRNGDNVRGKLEQATEKLRKQRVYLRTVGGRFAWLEYPDKNLREEQEWKDLREQYITSQLELAFLAGVSYESRELLEVEIRLNYPRYVGHPELG